MTTNLTYECPKCREPQRTTVSGVQRSIQCGSCRHELPLLSDAFQGESLRACLVCGTTDLYVQKDFPHRLGLAIVFSGILLSCIAWANFWYPAALGVLMATAVLDLCLYYLVGNALVCYRCLAQYRGTPAGAHHMAFDLAIGERYRQERIRLEVLRRAGHSSTGGSHGSSRDSTAAAAGSDSSRAPSIVVRQYSE